MNALEARYNKLVLVSKAVGDDDEAVTPAALHGAIEARCGVL